MMNNIHKNKYWTDEVEEAFFRYVSSDDASEKNKIFQKNLHTALRKLINDTIQQYCPDYNTIDRDIVDSMLHNLIIDIVRCNPNNMVSSNGKKSSFYLYCKIIIRGYIANYKLKRFREKQNISLDEIIL